MKRKGSRVPKVLREVREEVCIIEEVVEEVVEEIVKDVERDLHPHHYHIRITQENHMAIGTIAAGTTGTFAAELLANGVATPLPAGSTFAWTASDPSVTFETSPDTTSTVVTVPAGDAGTTLTITASTTTPEGAVSGELTVALTPAPQTFTVAVTQTA